MRRERHSPIIRVRGRSRESIRDSPQPSAVAEPGPFQSIDRSINRPNRGSLPSQKPWSPLPTTPLCLRACLGLRSALLAGRAPLSPPFLALASPLPLSLHGRCVAAAAATPNRTQCRPNQWSRPRKQEKRAGWQRWARLPSQGWGEWREGALVGGEGGRFRGCWRWSSATERPPPVPSGWTPPPLAICKESEKVRWKDGRLGAGCDGMAWYSIEWVVCWDGDRFSNTRTHLHIPTTDTSRGVAARCCCPSIHIG